MTIIALTAALNVADLGVGHSLVTHIAHGVGKEDTRLIRRYISSAMVFTTLIALSLGTLLACVSFAIPWAHVYNVSDPQGAAEAGPATVLLILLLLAGAPIGIVQRIETAHQRGFENGLWQAAGNFLGLAGLMAAVSIQLALPWLVLAFSGLPILLTLAHALTAFRTRYSHLRPKWSCVSASASARLFRSGLGFFALQLCALLAFASDNLIAAQILGPAAVAEYSIAARLFGLPALLVTTALMPLWPAYGEAVARGDIRWVRETLVRSIGLSLLVSGSASVVLVLWGTELIEWWVGPAVLPSASLLLGLGTWTVIQGLGNSVAMFLNGAGVIRFQVLSAFLLATGGIAAKALFGNYWGLPGIAWATVASYIVFVAIPYCVVVPRVLLDLCIKLEPVSPQHEETNGV